MFELDYGYDDRPKTMPFWENEGEIPIICDKCGRGVHPCDDVMTCAGVEEDRHLCMDCLDAMTATEYIDWTGDIIWTAEEAAKFERRERKVRVI